MSVTLEVDKESLRWETYVEVHNSAYGGQDVEVALHRVLKDVVAHVLDVDGCVELPLGDALACEQLARVTVDAKVCHIKLVVPELTVHQVPILDALFRHTVRTVIDAFCFAMETLEKINFTSS